MIQKHLLDVYACVCERRWCTTAKGAIILMGNRRPERFLKDDINLSDPSIF